MGVLLQALKIVFEDLVKEIVQRKSSNEKNKNKEKNSNLQNAFFSSLDPPTFKPHNFLFLIHFK
jgi:hypothetical protein